MIRIVKKKPYEAHEIAYQRMREKGILVWGQKRSGTRGKSSRSEIYRFLNDVLSQPWAPPGGRAIELGCGTGPILRRICKKGFRGVGIDVSKTAIAMAKEQSKGLGIRYLQGDVCDLQAKRLGTFDLVIDGLCLHCITQKKDRRAYLDSVRRLLKDDGVFILLTMCGPMDRKRFLEICKGQKIVKNVVYVPFEDKRYGRLVKIGGKTYLPSRYMGHWEEILGELRRADFELKLIRYKSYDRKDFCGTLTVGAVKGKGR